MDSETHDLHLAAGRIYGRESACGAKVNYGSEATATKAAVEMTAKYNGAKVLEAYPCVWCDGWHVGRAMTEAEWAAIKERMNS